VNCAGQIWPCGRWAHPIYVGCAHITRAQTPARIKRWREFRACHAYTQRYERLKTRNLYETAKIGALCIFTWPYKGAKSNILRCPLIPRTIRVRYARYDSLQPRISCVTLCKKRSTHLTRVMRKPYTNDARMCGRSAHRGMLLLAPSVVSFTRLTGHANAFPIEASKWMLFYLSLACLVAIWPGGATCKHAFANRWEIYAT
jgi:hypothetical protein